MEKKRYIQPAAEKVILNTNDNLMDFFDLFDNSVGAGLGKKNEQPVTVEDDEDELGNDSIGYKPSYKRYKPFEDWKGTVLDW